MPGKPAKAGGRDVNVTAKIAKAILDVVGNSPDSDEHKSKQPADRAREIASKAAANAALISGGLAVPVGPVGSGAKAEARTLGYDFVRGNAKGETCR